MKKYQKEFLLEQFFKNQYHIGWRGIAEKLIDTGKCIVAGKDCIWRGGIGNFINTKDVPDSYECLEYTFNLHSFLGSAWYKEQLKNSLEVIQSKIKELTQQFEELTDL